MRAIQESDLGLTPNTDGSVIRLNIPALTTERRKELVRLVGKMTEEARVAVRNVRRDVIPISRNSRRRARSPRTTRNAPRTSVQKLTDKHVERINELLHHKEEEILEV